MLTKHASFLHITLSVAMLGCLAVMSGRKATADDYELTFSTFVGGSDWEHARDVCVDGNGNVIIVGGTASTDFPTTEGAFQRSHDRTGKRIDSAGYCDAFVSKFSAEGRLMWSTLLGGPNYDRAYAVEVDPMGNIYVAGRAGPGFPVTDGAFQTKFTGSKQGIYGMQNGFVAKLSPDGSKVLWNSYVGTNQLCRDLSVDADGDVYLALGYTGKGALPPTEWFEKAYQPKPAGGSEIGAMKVTGDGSKVLWATWLGGSNNEIQNSGIRIDSDKNIYLNFTTKSTDVPTTKGAHDRSYNGEGDAFVAKLSADGRRLVYGTYFGGEGNEEGNSTHNLAVDSKGNAYLATSTTSKDLPVTKGAVQPRFGGGKRDIVVAKFSTTGALAGCTYLGGDDFDGADGIYADDAGNVFFTGNTASEDFPVTANALQKTRSKPRDAILVVLSADFQRLNFSSLLGGESFEDGRSCYLDQQGNLYVTGSANGAGWPMHHAHQPKFAGGGGGKELCYKGGCFAGDVILAKVSVLRDDANEE